MVAGDDLRLFGTRAAAESHVDPADIRAGAYPVAFDRDGRAHRFVIDDNGWGMETVRLSAIAGEPPRPQALRDHLARFLTRSGIGVRPTHTLAELLERAAGFITR